MGTELLQGEELMNELLKELRIHNQASQQQDTLWRVDHIAAYMCCSKSKAYKLISLPDFPRAIQISTTEDFKGQKAWLPEEVKDWIKQQRAPKKSGRPRKRPPTTSYVGRRIA